MKYTVKKVYRNGYGKFQTEPFRNSVETGWGVVIDNIEQQIVEIFDTKNTAEQAAQWHNEQDSPIAEGAQFNALMSYTGKPTAFVITSVFEVDTDRPSDQKFVGFKRPNGKVQYAAWLDSELRIVSGIAKVS